MELTNRTKPIDNKVKPMFFDQFQKSGDWMVPRGRLYYTPMGAFAKGMTGGNIFIFFYYYYFQCRVCLRNSCLPF